MLGMTPNSVQNFRNQSTSLDAFEATTYSTSMVESTMQDCLILFHEITPPDKVNINPLVNFHSSLSA
jgi:hypothetical protein